MSEMTKAREAFRALVQKETNAENFYAVIGTATDVSDSARTCTFTPLYGKAARKGIRLQSILSSTKGFVLIPKENSKVTVAFTDKQNGHVIATEELEKVHFEAGGEDLKTILNDLITQLKAAIIATPVGPGSIMPSTQTLLDGINTRINNFFY